MIKSLQKLIKLRLLKLRSEIMPNEEEKVIKLAKSTVFILLMLLLSSFFGCEAVFVLLLSLIYLKEG